MRKLFLFMMESLDGYFEGPNREIDWHNVDAEFNEFAIRQLDEVDTLLFGRVTYEVMASYWPTPSAIQDDPIVAAKMNSTPKIVFSRTMERAEWHNTRLVRDNLEDDIAAVKRQPGRDLAIFGSSNLAVACLQAGLLDELRIMINPVVLGSGKSLFHGLKRRQKLRLIKTRVFASGNVLLYYGVEG